jgi:predicted CoA-binding protein
MLQKKTISRIKWNISLVKIIRPPESPMTQTVTATKQDYTEMEWAQKEIFLDKKNYGEEFGLLEFK